MRLASFLIALMVLCVPSLAFSQEAYPDIFSGGTRIESEVSITPGTNTLLKGIEISDFNFGRVKDLPGLPDLTYTRVLVNTALLEHPDIASNFRFHPAGLPGVWLDDSQNSPNSITVKNTPIDITPGFHMISTKVSEGGIKTSSYFGNLGGLFFPGKKPDKENISYSMELLMFPNEPKMLVRCKVATDKISGTLYEVIISVE